jgi:hypothetical protein
VRRIVRGQPRLFEPSFEHVRGEPKTATAQRSRGGESLAIYRDLALADVSGEYEQAMRSFPVR